MTYTRLAPARETVQSVKGDTRVRLLNKTCSKRAMAAKRPTEQRIQRIVFSFRSPEICATWEPSIDDDDDDDEDDDDDDNNDKGHSIRRRVKVAEQDG